MKVKHPLFTHLLTSSGFVFFPALPFFPLFPSVRHLYRSSRSQGTSPSILKVWIRGLDVCLLETIGRQADMAFKDQSGETEDAVDINGVLRDLAEIPAEPRKQRDRCDRCGRPIIACWCSSLPPKTLDLKSKVFILQHPLEEKRNLRTATILEIACGSNCQVIKGRKFGSNSKNPDLQRILTHERSRTFVLYPGDKSIKLQDLPVTDEGYNILVIDGTWNQAKSMYANSPELQSLTKVEIDCGQPSTYVIRTQPLEGCLSTVETAALALSHVENNPSIYSILMKPLDALCNFQLERGAVKHHSKEYLVLNGLHDKNMPIPKDVKKKLKNILQQRQTEDGEECKTKKKGLSL